MGNSSSNKKVRNDFNRIGNALNPRKNGTAAFLSTPVELHPNKNGVSAFFSSAVEKTRSIDYGGAARRVEREGNYVFRKMRK